LDGRRRLWPKEKKIRLSEMINHPIQGLNATITKLAIARIHRTFEQLQTSALLVNTVHDEIVIECPLDEIEPIQHIIIDCMVKAGQQFLEPIPVLVETKIF
jgi:DNA polymerase-1